MTVVPWSYEFVMERNVLIGGWRGCRGESISVMHHVCGCGDAG